MTKHKAVKVKESTENSSGLYQVRNMTRGELGFSVKWAQKEGWNPGIHDADCFWAQDPKGFFVGTIDNKLVATVSAVRYGDKYGFMGFYIVKPEYRGKGYGMELFMHAWKYMDNRNIGGDGVLENLAKYSKLGLKLEHYNARYQGNGKGGKKLSLNVVHLSKIKFSDLYSYDDAVFGFPRHEFIKLWVSRPETVALGYTNNGQLRGYGVIRKCFTGYKIGPLFADDDHIASALFDSLVGQIDPGESVFYDLPECNKHALEIAKSYNMTKVFATGRIYTQGQPNFPLKKWYGITSFELG